MRYQAGWFTTMPLVFNILKLSSVSIWNVRMNKEYYLITCLISQKLEVINKKQPQFLSLFLKLTLVLVWPAALESYSAWRVSDSQLGFTGSPPFPPCSELSQALMLTQGSKTCLHGGREASAPHLLKAVLNTTPLVMFIFNTLTMLLVTKYSSAKVFSWIADCHTQLLKRYPLGL